MQRFLNKKRKLGKRGFTLIELIVVIAVIGVLVLLAAPKFLGYTRDAKVAALQSDIKTLSNAALLYNIESTDDIWPVGNVIVGGLLNGNPDPRFYNLPLGLRQALVAKGYENDDMKNKIITLPADAIQEGGILYKYIKNLNNPPNHYIVVVEGILEGEVFHVGPASGLTYPDAGYVSGDRLTRWYGVDANVTLTNTNGDHDVVTTHAEVNGIPVGQLTSGNGYNFGATYAAYTQ